jgi:thiosulfate/3-mercaptopyruvate sulfurtransferase
VSILDGGLPRWIDEGGEVEMGEVGESGAVEYNVKEKNKDLLRCK